MTPEDILNDLKNMITADATLAEALSRFIDHYAATEVEGCDKNADGDMLLFQWGGPYDWDPACSINLTRQFSHLDADGEYDGMEQLSMDCRFDPARVSMESGSQWLEGGDVEAFKSMVLQSAVVARCDGENMESIDWELSEA